MGLLARIFAPDSVGQLANITRQAEWYRDRLEESCERIRQLEQDKAAEVRRNRKREDDLSNQILELGGGRRLAERENSPVGVELQPSSDTEKKAQLTEAEKAELHRRAIEYCEAKAGEGEIITATEIAQVENRMLENPYHWLGNR
jgi:hypothetical protein